MGDWPSWLQFLAALWFIVVTLICALGVFYIYELRRDLTSMQRMVKAWTMLMVTHEMKMEPDPEDLQTIRDETERQLRVAAKRERTLGDVIDRFREDHTGSHRRSGAVSPRSQDNEDRGGITAGSSSSAHTSEDRIAGIPNAAPAPTLGMDEDDYPRLEQRPYPAHPDALPGDEFGGYPSHTLAARVYRAEHRGIDDARQDAGGTGAAQGASEWFDTGSAEGDSRNGRKFDGSAGSPA